ncbi:MAG: glutamate synthase subunit alpha, partial [Candidatus Delongbacteria bacterium]|nr:glutamate synthase subunit alpha [Candidatus Delongbacteria bacterium]
GQLKTGRDIVIAALLGAEEFGFGTMTLIALGCVMMRKCHLNHCAAGIATQDPQLRRHFQGKPEYIERLMMFLANQVREIMAELGFRRFEDMVGRSDRLRADPEIPFWKARCLDLSPLHQSMGHKPIHHPVNTEPGESDKTLDCEIMPQVREAIEQRKPIRLNLAVNNTHRSLGASLSYEITRRYGREGLPEGTIRLDLKGAVGQSCGVFLAPGITLHIQGAANDYLGKGMAGGRIIVQPDPASGFIPHANVIAGNVALYGATGGELYINGKAGERFAVRNSGAKAVVEGIGDHGCEYMTGGIIVVIGKTGRNFAAGMSGGVAYVYDETQMFDTRCNLDMVDLESVWDPHDSKLLYEMLAAHRNYTHSPQADFILTNWESCRPIFVKVIPIDYRKSLERRQILEEMDLETVSATEEVYHG